MRLIQAKLFHNPEQIIYINVDAVVALWFVEDRKLCIDTRGESYFVATTPAILEYALIKLKDGHWKTYPLY